MEISEALFWMSNNLPVWRDFALLILATIFIVALYIMAWALEATS